MMLKGVEIRMSAKIQYLIKEANNKRVALINIDGFLKTKKNMAYGEWKYWHWLFERLQGEIREIDEEILRIEKGVPI